MSQIKKNLEEKFLRHRIVFWYDGTGEWRKDYETTELEGVTRVWVDGNELGTKLRVLQDEAERKFLLYFGTPRPADADNWLLDVLLAHDEFHADRASLTLHELGLAPDFKNIAVEHAEFFADRRRREALKGSIQKDEDHGSLRRKMMAVVTGAPVDGSLDGVLLQLCNQAGGEPTLDLPLDPVEQSLDRYGLSEPFWKDVGRHYGYGSQQPSLQDFLIELFQTNVPLSGDGTRLSGQAVVFLSRWKDSTKFRGKFEEISRQFARDLGIEGILQETRNVESLAEYDAYEVIDQRIIHWLLERILKGELIPDIRKRLFEARRRSFWYEKYGNLYGALEHGAELLERIGILSVHIESVAGGMESYTRFWWAIDFHYRKFQECRQRSLQPGLLGVLADKVELAYVNAYLMPLASGWEGALNAHTTWPPRGIARNRGFFDEVVKPVLARNQKLFVIISDALRYECAMELQKRLLAEDRYTANLDARLAGLPTTTQFGMAALLPHASMSHSEDGKTVSADGKSTVGTKNREAILQAGAGVSACFIDARKFLELNTKKEGRDLMKAHELIYITHDVIDDVGDDRGTEQDLPIACAKALDELVQVIKKVTAINGTNMVVVSDHGFIFQQQDVDEADCQPVPEGNVIDHARRYVFGRGLPSDSVIRRFASANLGYQNEEEIGIVKGIQRLRLKGSGKRYVHGGAMPQECIIPVLTVNKARTSDIRTTEVDVLALPSKLTTNTVVLRLYQTEPVSVENKVSGRELRVGFFGKAGQPISDEQTIKFDSTEPDPRNREMLLTLTLGHEAYAFNNEDVCLRLIEKISTTQKTRAYKETTTRLALRFGSDFDEF